MDFLGRAENSTTGPAAEGFLQQWNVPWIQIGHSDFYRGHCCLRGELNSPGTVRCTYRACSELRLQYSSLSKECAVVDLEYECRSRSPWADCLVLPAFVTESKSRVSYTIYNNYKVYTTYSQLCGRPLTGSKGLTWLLSGAEVITLLKGTSRHWVASQITS